MTNSKKIKLLTRKTVFAVGKKRGRVVTETDVQFTKTSLCLVNVEKFSENLFSKSHQPLDLHLKH